MTHPRELVLVKHPLQYRGSGCQRGQTDIWDHPRSMAQGLSTDSCELEISNTIKAPQTTHRNDWFAVYFFKSITSKDSKFMLNLVQITAITSEHVPAVKKNLHQIALNHRQIASSSGNNFRWRPTTANTEIFTSFLGCVTLQLLPITWTWMRPSWSMRNEGWEQPRKILGETSHLQSL